MRRSLFSRVSDTATKVETWLALGGYLVGTGAFTWLATQWSWLASHGWAAVLTVGTIGGAAVLTAICSLYFAVSQFRKSRVSGPSGDPPLSFDEMQARILEETRRLYADPKLPIVERKYFLHAHLLLDGKHFIGCSFDECTLEFNGGPVSFSECKLKDNSNKSLSRHPAVLLANYILRAAGFIRQDYWSTTIPIDNIDSPLDLPTIKVIKNVD